LQMVLQVNLVKTPGGISQPRNNHTFDQRGGTFGRADSNSWVLPDPDKFLSSCHCEIVYVDKQFYLEDKSTNGTFVNGSFEPLGRGIRHQLKDNDFFEIGDYRFTIQLEGASKDAFESPFDVASRFNTPAASAQPKTDIFGESFGDPALFDQQQDPLALWDKRPQPGGTPFDATPAHSADKATNALLDDFVGLSKSSASEDSYSTMDTASSMDQAISWPAAKSERLIPEDWADDLMGQSSELEVPVTKTEVIPEDDLMSPFAAAPAASSEKQFDIPKPSARIPLAERIFAMETPQSALVPPLQKPDIHTADTLVPEKKPHVPLASTAGQVENAGNRALIEALGLDMSRLSEADMLEVNHVVGLLMREIVDGMLGVLRSRASIKNEFRMNVTTIQPVENNPLKFSVCVDDALENLFIKKSKAYKKPVDAFREGFQEIAEHQLAMIAGIRQGFEAMMERFNPEQLEKSFSKQAKGSVIPGMQKAKYWTSYSDYYRGFSDNMESSFQHLFGSDFVSAYEDQLRRLVAARKRGDSNDNT
jgi:type VI secretion system protein